MLMGCIMPLTSVAAPVAAPAPYPLTETYTLTEFGFTIDYPAGWHTGRDGPTTIICELEEDVRRLQIDNDTVSGYCILHEHRDMRFMRSIGLPVDATIEDLFQFNSDFFGYQEPEVSASTLFGAPAIQVITVDETGPTLELTGFLDDEAFLLSLQAPTTDALDAFLPTWAAIVAAIAPVATE
jgi:hypothetical protein